MTTENQQPETAPVQVSEKNITDQVLNKITAFQASGDIVLPKDYVPGNALKSAWLVLQETKDKQGNLALNICTKESVANALLKMVVWGLSPLKKQCDFIVRGNQLSCDPEYTGNLVLAKRFGGLKDYKANAIFKGDVFSFEVMENGRKKLLKHEQKLESYGGEVIGAYMTYELQDGTKDMEIMNIIQIRNAWMQGAGKGNTIAHNNFTDQMAIKTVINRGCKLLIRASDDSVLMGPNDDGEGISKDTASAAVQHNINTNANKEELNIEDAVLVSESSVPGTDPKPNHQQNS